MEYLYLQIKQLNLYLASQNWTPCRSCTPVLRTQTLSWELLLSGERSLHSTAKSCTIRWQWVITNQNVRNFREAKSFFGFLENVCSKFNFPMSPHVRLSVIWLVCRSVQGYIFWPFPPGVNFYLNRKTGKNLWEDFLKKEGKREKEE